MVDAKESFEEVAGCRVRLHRGGRGEPLLFLHGARGAAQWLPFMERLTERFEVIVPEHPGFGASQTPDWLDNVADLASFYLAFLRHLDVGPVHLVGTSLGGWIAAELAVRNTAVLRTLVLVAAAGIHVKGVQKGDIFLWNAEQMARNLVADATLAERMLAQPLDEDAQEQMLKNNLTMARLAWQPRLYDPHLAKWLHLIDVPTLIVWGDSDQVIPPAYGPAFQALIPGSRLEVIADCGHLPQIERTDAFVGAITTFIDEVRG